LEDCQQANAVVPGVLAYDVKDSEAKCKFYMGLTWDQFVGGIVWVQQKIKCFFELATEDRRQVSV